MAGMWSAVKGMFAERKLTAAEEAELADLRNRKIGAANGTSVTYRDVLFMINQYVEEKEAEGGVLGGTPGPHEVIRSGKLQGVGPKFPIRFDSTAMLRLYTLLGSKAQNTKGGSRRNRRRQSRRRQNKRQSRRNRN